MYIAFHWNIFQENKYVYLVSKAAQVLVDKCYNYMQIWDYTKAWESLKIWLLFDSKVEKKNGVVIKEETKNQNSKFPFDCISSSGSKTNNTKKKIGKKKDISRIPHRNNISAKEAFFFIYYFSILSIQKLLYNVVQTKRAYKTQHI